MNMESIYEYGSRAGFWRLHRLFTQRQMPVTVFGVAMALARNPAAVAAMQDADWEIASHGYRWIDYQFVPEEMEREHLALAIELAQAGDRRPARWAGISVAAARTRAGWSPRKAASSTTPTAMPMNCPIGSRSPGGRQLIVPYTLDANDMRFATSQGFNSGDQFFTYLKDSFDLLYAEGETSPRMMSVGLHCRLVGRPGRAAALARFLDYVRGHHRVWVCRRIDIARHWRAIHPYKAVQS